MTTSLIHFGLAKTATTYLQKAVFPQARGVNYLGKPFHTPGQAVLQSLSQRRWCVPLDRFLKDEAALRSRERADFHQLERQVRRALSGDALNVWSHEGFLRPTRDTAPFARKRALANLRRVFEAAGSERIHALLILRDTRALMTSYARQFLHELTSRGLEPGNVGALYKARVQDSTEISAKQLWDLWYCYFDFGGVIADLRGVFGAEHVHVLNYDALTPDWSALRAVISRIHPEAWLDFPDVRMNDSREKAADTSPRLIHHLQALETLDLARLYPENDRHLHRAAR